MSQRPPRAESMSASDEQALFEVDDTLSVRDLTQRFAKMLRREFGNEVWVRGQIRDLNRASSGHVYFSLVEPVEHGRQPDTLIKVVLFDSTKQIVNRILTRSGAGRFEDGMEIRIRAEVDFYAPQGSLQLRMTTIDPEYTLGRLAADREHLLRLLASEDLLDRNAQIPLTLVPQTIALVTSSGSAAEADFRNHLDASGYAWDLTIWDARVQGVTAAESVARAIMLAAKRDPDVICVVRGGGSRTDLSTFDTEPVARAIATCSVPVFCGIGHEIDRSLADEVAARSLKTPTACAQVLIDAVAAADARFVELGRRIAGLARLRPAEHQAECNQISLRLTESARRATTNASRRIELTSDRVQRGALRKNRDAAAKIAQHGDRLQHGATAALDRASKRHDRLAGSLTRSAPRAIRSRTGELDAIESRVRLLDPVNVLRRGWSITTTADGAVVSSITDATGELHTRVADGVITSTVVTTEPVASPLDTDSQQDENDDLNT